MTEAEQAFEAAKQAIAKAQAEGAERLSFDEEAFRALEEIPAEIGALDNLVTLDLDNTQVSDLAPLAALTGLQVLRLTQTGVTDLAPLAALTGLQVLWLDQTGVTDLRPLRALDKLATDPKLGGLQFKDCAACKADPKIAEISEITKNRDRARRLFDYLEDWVPPGVPEDKTGATVFEAANALEKQFRQIGGLGRSRPSEPPPAHRPDARQASHSPVSSSISVGQIKQVMRDSYPDLKDRAAQLVALIQQESSAHAMLARPNDPIALRAYEEKEEFLKTMSAGLVSIHEELPETPSVEISEEKAQALRDKLIHLAGLLDNTIRYLDADKGTYGGLYKLGLISGVASLLALIPGVTFVTGAALPTLVFGVQTFRVVVGRDDQA